jgi:hypothetical protein
MSILSQRPALDRLVRDSRGVDIERARSPFQDIGGNRLFAERLAR